MYELRRFSRSHSVDSQQFSNTTWYFRVIGQSYIWSANDTTFEVTRFKIFSQACLRLVGNGEIGTGDALVSATDGVADLFVFGLLDGGFVGLCPWKSAKPLLWFQGRSLDHRHPSSLEHSRRLSGVRALGGDYLNTTILTLVKLVWTNTRPMSMNVFRVTVRCFGYSPSFCSPL